MTDVFAVSLPPMRGDHRVSMTPWYPFPDGGEALFLDVFAVSLFRNGGGEHHVPLSPRYPFPMGGGIVSR